MESLQRVGKLLIGEYKDVPFAMNFDHIVSMQCWEGTTIIKTVINYELKQGFYFPKEWYETILTLWKEYVVYGG